MLWKKLSIWMLALGLVVVMAPGCSDDDETVTPGGGTDQFEVVRTALNDYLAAGTPPTISAADVFDDMSGDIQTQQVVSVRGASHYAIGHVDGATNTPWREIADVAELATIDITKEIYVYCYTGHTAGVATTVLNALGYNARNMKWGVMSWTRDPDVRIASAFDQATDGHDYAVETTANVPTETYPAPTLDVTSSTSSYDVIRAAADAYVSDTDTSPVILAADVHDIIQDDGWEDDYQIVSVRSADHYAIGHIPGAINIPWRNIAETENLEKLDPAKEIIVYCYTGHTAGVATTTLQMLGYNAKNMKFGIVAWTEDQTVRVASAFDDATDAHDYPTVPYMSDDFMVVRDALQTYLSSGEGPVAQAPALFDITQESGWQDDNQIVSVRSSDSYDIGHVPDATNTPWRSIADTDQLATIDASKDIYVYCYTGHTAGVATTVLNALGYNAKNMKWGIMSWTQDANVRVQNPYNQATDGHDFPVSTDAVATSRFAPADLDVAGTANSEIIRAAADAYVSDTGTAPVISAQAVFDITQDDGWEDDYQIVSVRSATHYDLGHIPGAINIPWREIADSDNLRVLDPAKQIIIYCYTGHTGGVATTTLQMLGYDALNMKFGIVAWTEDPTVRATSAFDEATHANDFPTEATPPLP